ncbi:MAG TPA: NAD(P)/FAD-dependent oxidoreductase [Ruminiclostridium sp.]|nr:NAD(P)/FAD-dependent oxidoreductase [Ruminiclostridium sp.]
MQNSRKSIIIIGAGLSGMSSGCYAQMNGYSTEIFEMHFIPGGCCTAWDRGEYTFDCTIEWLLGSREGSPMNGIWQELGALKEKRIKDFDVFNSYRGLDGRTVSFYADPDKLETHLKEISAEDSKPIEEFCNYLRSFEKINDFITHDLYKPEVLCSQEEKEKMGEEVLPYLEILKKTIGINIREFAEGFKEPLLQQAFKNVMFFEQNHFPLMPTCFNLRSAVDRDAGFPEGGSLGLAKSIEKRYGELGGRINYSKKVSSIIVDNDRAIGVKLEDGSEHLADIVVSACDGYYTVMDMLKGKYENPELDLLYKKYAASQPQIVYPGMAITFLGVNRDLSTEPHSITYQLTDQEAENLTGITQSKTLLLQIRTQHSPEFAKEGKSVIAAYYMSEYDKWKELRNDRPAYEREKKKVGDYIIEYANRIYPGLREQVEVIDVSTPITIERYTGNHKGSCMGWQPFSEAEEPAHELVDKYGMKLPGLKNLYVTGHWVSMGGLIRNASSGRHVVQFICRDDGKEFKTVNA